jgi:hypothetical protein
MAPPPLQTVVETPEFLAHARGLLTEQERSGLVDFLARNPTAGDLMQGTGGARKLRWGAKGKGKSGGARVITFYGGPQAPAFLLTAFGKGKRANLTKAERNELRAVLAHLLAEYRRGAS